MSSLDFSNIRVALVADWITDRGGAELVFDQFLALFPNADIFTSVFFREHDPIYSGRKIVTSFIQKIPFLNRRHKMALFLRPFAFRQFDFSNYDLVISSSSAESKGIRVPKNTLHICYCHTPTRYFWSHEKEYRSMMEFGFLNPLARFVFDALLDPLKKLDLEASKQPHFYIANSENTRSRIAAFYGRDSVVVPPGIDTSLYTLKREELRCPPLAGTGENSIKLRVISISEKFACPHQPLAPSSPSSWEEGEKEEDLGKKPGFFPRSEKARRHSWSNFLGSKFFLNFIGLWAWGDRTVSEERSFVWKAGSYSTSPQEYYFAVGRIVPYKKFDLLVDVFNANGKKLIIATNTRNKLAQELQTKSKPNITWVWGAGQKEISTLYQNARALLFPQEEDFGIVPLEAMACGTPVIAYRKGGALETVVEWKTGIFFGNQTPESLNQAIQRFETITLDPDTIRNHAKWFDQSIFREKILRFIEEKWNEKDSTKSNQRAREE